MLVNVWGSFIHNSQKLESAQMPFNRSTVKLWCTQFVKHDSAMKRNKFLGFSGGSAVKNPPASAGDTGSIPGLMRSHMLWSNKARAPHLLSLCARAREPQLLKPVCPRARPPQQEKSLQWGARTPQLENSRCSLQLEEVHTQQGGPSTDKRK